MVSASIVARRCSTEGFISRHLLTVGRGAGGADALGISESVRTRESQEFHPRFRDSCGSPLAHCTGCQVADFRNLPCAAYRIDNFIGVHALNLSSLRF